MTRTTKLLALLLALGMLLSLAACGGAAPASSAPAEQASAEAPAAEAEAAEPAPTEEPAEAPDGEPAEASAAEPAEAPAEEPAEDPNAIHETTSGAEYNSEAYMLPLFGDEDVSFTARISFPPNDLTLFGDEGYAINHAVQKAEEMTGVHIDWTVVNSEAAMEQFSLQVASGTYEDIIVDAASHYSSTLANGVEENVFVDIRPYLSQCMPFFKSTFENALDDTKRCLITEAGYIVGVSSISDYDERQREGLMIRKDYLDTLGLDIPETYDDLHTVLTAFKNELGLSDPIFFASDFVYSSNALVSGYDVLGTFSTTGFVVSPWYQVDGQVKYGIMEDGYYEYISMIHDWYDEGLISHDFVSREGNPNSMTNMGTISSGVVGMFHGEIELIPIYMMGQTTDPNFEIALMPDIVKTPGQTTHLLNNKTQLSRAAATCVTTSCWDVEKALTWLDFFFSDDGALLCNVGVEGESYEMVDGKIQYLDSFLNNPDYNEKERNCIFLMASIPKRGLDVPKTYSLDIQYQAEDVWTTHDDGAYILPTISLNEEETSEYAQRYSDISTYLAEHLTKYVTGEDDITQWDSFLDTLNAMDMQECIDIYQGALDRFYDTDITID